jgi:hypothetical protein
VLLLANGCSHTAGAEIEYETQDNCYDKAYPKTCAEELGWGWVNLAVSGASQERIIRTTIDWVGRNYKNYSNSELYVVIMWSASSRTEFYSKSRRNYVQVVPGNDEVYKKQFTKAEYLYYQSYVVLQNRSAQIAKWYNNVILLQSYLKSMNIRYLFLNATEPLPEYASLPHLIRQIDNRKYPWAHDSNNSFLNLVINIGYKMAKHTEKGFCHHVGEDAHIFYGKNIAKYIKETVNGSI